MLPESVCELLRLFVECVIFGLERGLGLTGLEVVGLGVGLVLVGVY
jgi:hypothetical protein